MVKTYRSSWIFFLLIFYVTLLNATENTLMNQTFADRQDVQQFIEKMVEKHHLDRKKLISLFSAFGPEPKIIQAISKPFEAMPWYRYRDRFVTEEKAKQGALFYKKHEALLKKAETEFGVPAEIIVAIIAVETRYGENTGKYPVLQSLATLAFDYPPRAAFFLNELEQFLLLTHEEHLNPLSIYGSYAGAMGIPQFIPSSYRRFAVDFSATGSRDLMNDVGDAIGSVANYFKMHGWQRGAAIAYPAHVSGDQYLELAKELKAKDPKPQRPIEAFAKYGIYPDASLSSKEKSEPAIYIMLESSASTKEHWLGLYNFYVITRYNHSLNYAMAVYQLSQKIRSLHKQLALE